MTAADEKLLFAATRWAAVSIAHTARVPSMEGLIQGAAVPNLPSAQASPLVWSRLNPRGRGAVPPGFAGQPTPCNVFTLAVTDASCGRHWASTEPEMFWRSFSELDFIDGDGTDVLRFVRRRGDLHNVLARRQQVDTADWVGPVLHFSQVAQAWEPADLDGVSILATDPERLRTADAALRTLLLPTAARACDLVPDPAGLGLVTRALNMHAYMVVAAASALRRAVPMRQCTNCSEWFEQNRRDQQFCGASCRASYAAAERAAGHGAPSNGNKRQRAERT